MTMFLVKVFGETLYIFTAECLKCPWCVPRNQRIEVGKYTESVIKPAKEFRYVEVPGQ